MTGKEREHVAVLESTIIDRERRLFTYASIIRRLTRDGVEIPRDVTVDYAITPDEARVLGIENYAAAVEARTSSG